MKATYQKPVTDIITLSSHANILTVSGGGLLGDGEKPNDLDLENAGTTDAVSGNLSRRKNVWDDEQEEEF